MSRLLISRTVILVALCLLPTVAWTQSEKEGAALLKQGRELRSKAKSKADLEECLDKFDRAGRIFKSVNSPPGIGKTLNETGFVYSSLGEYQKALEHHEKALEIFEKIRDIRGEGATLRIVGNSYFLLGQYQKSLEHHEKALEIYKRVGGASGEAGTLMNMGSVYTELGQYQKSLENHGKALEIFEKIGDVGGEGATLMNLGILYSSLGQYRKALQHHAKALEIFEKSGYIRSEGATLSYMGTVYSSLGQYQKALEHYEKSLEIFNKIGGIAGEGANWKRMGDVYCMLGQYQKALEHHEKALEIDKKIGGVGRERKTLLGMGGVYTMLGQYRKALEYHEKALEICKRSGVPHEGTEDLIGQLYLDMGNLNEAELILKRTRRWGSLGRLALMQSDFAQAKKHYEKYLSRAQKSGNVGSLFVAHTGLGLAFEGLEQYEQASDHFRSAVGLTERLRSGITESQRESFLDVKIGGFGRTAPYKGLARVLLKLGKPAAALTASEYSKARTFAESLSQGSRVESVEIPPEVLGKDQELGDSLAALSKNLQEAFEKGLKETVENIEPQIKKLEKDYEMHKKMLREQYPLYAATRYPEPMELSQTALKNHEWVLSYDVTDDGVIIYLTQGKKLVQALFKPVPRKDLDELVRTFRGSLEVVAGKDRLLEKLTQFDLVSAKKLGDILLIDILSDLPADAPVIVVPDDSLGIVPFEALILNDGGRLATDKDIPYVSGAEFFGDRNPVSYSQSLTALTLARTFARKKNPGDKLLVMADPVFHMKDARLRDQKEKTMVATGVQERTYAELMAAMEEGQTGVRYLPRLRYTGVLAEELAKTYGGKCDVYTGLGASKGQFIKCLGEGVNQYDQIVFATHGYFGQDLPGIMEPVLILTLVPPGADGYLRMSEVMGLKLNAEIVALTACQTGLGKRISGEGTMGMGRAFQYAGARSVLMSLWSVAESSSVDFAQSFFKHLREGKSKLEALKLARKQIRDTEFDHPFFWAPFILVGELESIPALE